MKLTLRWLFTVAIGLTCAWAQKTGTTGGSTGTTTGGTSTTTGGTTGTSTGTSSSLPVTTPAPTTTLTPAAPRPIYLSGTVVLDDGSPLPGSMNIQSVCGGQRRVVAHTSSSGDFGFMWNNNAGSVFEDASENGRAPGSSGNSGTASGSSLSGTGSSGAGSRLIDPLANCDLRADLAGFTSSSVSLANRTAFDNADVGAIVLHRITGDEGRVVSILSLKAPKDARKSFDKGMDQARANKAADAAASFKKAVAVYPQYADAWLSLGRVQSQLGLRDDARTDFQKAMDLDDKLVGPWQELGYMASDAAQWENAARYLDQAVRLDPMDSPMAWYFSAMANYNLGRYDVAERNVRAEMKLDRGKNTHAEYLLGMVLIARKDLQGGVDALRNYIATAPQSAELDTAKKQLSRLEGQTGQLGHQ